MYWAKQELADEIAKAKFTVKLTGPCCAAKEVTLTKSKDVVFPDQNAWGNCVVKINSVEIAAEEPTYANDKFTSRAFATIKCDAPCFPDQKEQKIYGSYVSSPTSGETAKCQAKNALIDQLAGSGYTAYPITITDNRSEENRCCWTNTLKVDLSNRFTKEDCGSLPEVKSCVESGSWSPIGYGCYMTGSSGGKTKCRVSAFTHLTVTKYKAACGGTETETVNRSANSSDSQKAQDWHDSIELAKCAAKNNLIKNINLDKPVIYSSADGCCLSKQITIDESEASCLGSGGDAKCGCGNEMTIASQASGCASCSGSASTVSKSVSSAGAAGAPGGDFNLGCQYLPSYAAVPSCVGAGWRPPVDMWVAKKTDTKGKLQYVVRDGATYHTLKPTNGKYAGTDPDMEAYLAGPDFHDFVLRIGGKAYRFGVPCGTTPQAVLEVLDIVVENNADLGKGIGKYDGVNHFVFKYDSKGLLRTIDSVDTQKTVYTLAYDANNMLSTISYGELVIFSFAYVKNQQCLRSRSQLGEGTTTFTYEAMKNGKATVNVLKTITAPDQKVTRFNLVGCIANSDPMGERNDLLSVDFTRDGTEWWPATTKTYDSMCSQSVYSRPLDKAGAKMSMATSTVFNDVSNGPLYTRKTIEENGAVAQETFVSASDLKVSSSTYDPALALYRNGSFSYTDSNRLEAVSIAYSSKNLVPGDSYFHHEFTYAPNGLVQYEKDRQGVEYWRTYNPGTRQIASQFSTADGKEISKISNTYYPATAPAGRKYRLETENVCYGVGAKDNYVTTYDYYNASTDPGEFPNFGKLKTVVFPDKSSVSFTYGCCGVTSVRNRFGGVTQYEYYPADATPFNPRYGKLKSVTTPGGAVTGFDYNSSGADAGKLKSKSLPGGGVETYTYDKDSGRLAAISYPDSTAETFQFRLDGQLSKRIDRLGKVTRFYYNDKAGDLPGYNPDGTLLKITVADGEKGVETVVSLKTYDGFGRLASATDARGLKLAYQYAQGFGSLEAIVWPDGSQERITFKAADTRHLDYTATDRLGRNIDYAFDNFGRLSSVLFPDRTKNAYTYDNASRVSAVIVSGITAGPSPISALRTSFSSTFDNLPASVGYPDGSSETCSYAYTGSGMTGTHTDRSGKVWTTVYDKSGFVDTLRAGDTVVEAYDYANDLPLYHTSADGVKRKYLYDSMGRLTMTSLPDDSGSYGSVGFTTSTSYDLTKRTITTVDRKGGSTIRQYDSLGNLIQVKMPPVPCGYIPPGIPIFINSMFAYNYNVAGDLLTFIDTKGNITGWSYDREGRPTSKTFADATTDKYEYDRGGNVVRRTDANNVATLYSYDAMGRPLAINFGANADTEISFAYDSLGNRTSMNDPSGQTTWNYDYARGARLIAENQPGATAVNYTYDPSSFQVNGVSIGAASLSAYSAWDGLGRLGKAQAYSSNATSDAFGYSYWKAGGALAAVKLNGADFAASVYRPRDAALTTLTYSPTGAVKYTVNNAGERTGISLPGGPAVTLAYDALGRINAATYNPPSGRAQYNYTYDLMDNGVTRDTITAKYSNKFNNLNQLTAQATGTDTERMVDISGAVTALRAKPTVTVQVTGYSESKVAELDATGAWKAREVRAKKGVAQRVDVAATDVFGRKATTYASITPAAGADTTAFSYDANGNLLKDGARTYLWDADNQLISVSVLAPTSAADSVRVDFLYDGLGRRRLKSVFGWDTAAKKYKTSPSSSVRFVYDGWMLVAELDALKTNTVIRTYAWGVDLSGTVGGAGGVGGLLAVKDASGVYYPTYDGNGNILSYLQLDAATKKLKPVAAYVYDPFGDALASAGVKANDLPLRFSTKYLDRETGLYYFGYRYYSPRTARWLSRDPLAESGGPNLYGFADGVNGFDPLGLERMTIGQWAFMCHAPLDNNVRRDYNKEIEVNDQAFEQVRRLNWAAIDRQIKQQQESAHYGTIAPVSRDVAGKNAWLQGLGYGGDLSTPLASELAESNANLLMGAVTGTSGVACKAAKALAPPMAAAGGFQAGVGLNELANGNPAGFKDYYSGLFLAGMGMAAAQSSAASGGGLESNGFGKWVVGEHGTLRRSAQEGLDSHHVGQDKAMRCFVQEYDRETAPAILVPKIGHTVRINPDVPTLARKSTGFASARGLIARDIRELRRVYPDVPNSQLQKLIDLNKTKYPNAVRK